MGVILLPGAVFPIAVFCPVAIFAIAIPVIAVAIASTSSGGSSVDNIARKLRPPAGDAVHGVGHLVPGEAVIAHHIEYLIR